METICHKELDFFTILMTFLIRWVLRLINVTFWYCVVKSVNIWKITLNLVKVVKIKVTQSCPTLCDLMDYTVHGILHARILEWVAFPISRGSSQPRDWTQVSHIAGGFFTSWATREALGVPSKKNLKWKFRFSSIQFSSAQSLSRVRLFATPRTAARQASLSITNSWSLFKLMSIESVMPCNHFILCCPLLLLPSIFPSITVFSNESAQFQFQLQHQSFQWIFRTDLL